MALTLIDRYLLAQTFRRLMVALGVVLLALVLERILRLFEFAADHGGAFLQVLQMAVNLLPHYLGMALPAGFFISILLLMARLGDDNEIDVLLSSGLSIRRLARPLLLTGALLTVFSIVLYGYVQPYSRYAYRAIRHAAVSAVWDGSVPPQTFLTPAEGLTLYADQADADGQRLGGVFVHQRDAGGREVVSTAERGRLHADYDIGRAYLVLEDGVQVVTRPEKPPLTVAFDELTLSRDFPLEPPPYRDRGRDEREMTLHELWRGVPSTTPGAAEGNGDDEDSESVGTVERLGEAHGRLVRALSITLMPLLAVPMGIAAKRRRRGKAIVVAAVILVLYHHMLETGEGLVQMGAIPAFLGLWLPFAVFAGVCAVLFRRAEKQPGQNPFEYVFERFDTLVEHLLGRILRRLRRPT
ncbi:MAG TPA: LPS export ABC transporter permease LptF [Thermohalobaculum sp.]|nr:LPS export ABC transporter permease LptF [Thermohalobaculum sp.]